MNSVAPFQLLRCVCTLSSNRWKAPEYSLASSRVTNRLVNPLRTRKAGPYKGSTPTYCENRRPLCPCNRGDAHFSLRQFDLAIADFNHVIDRDPNAFQAYYNRGNAYAAKGALSTAVDDLTKAISLRPDLPNAYYNRAINLGRMGNQNDAIADLRKAVEIDPSYQPARKALLMLGISPIV